jgi:hypothetical protein
MRRPSVHSMRRRTDLIRLPDVGRLELESRLQAVPDRLKLGLQTARGASERERELQTLSHRRHAVMLSWRNGHFIWERPAD